MKELATFLQISFSYFRTPLKKHFTKNCCIISFNLLDSSEISYRSSKLDNVFLVVFGY